MAAPILAYEDLGVIQGHGWLFRHLDIHIGARDRLALIGRNGAGKTTLLKLIAGAIDADALGAAVVLRRGLHVLNERARDAVLGAADADALLPAGVVGTPGFGVSHVHGVIGGDEDAAGAAPLLPAIQQLAVLIEDLDAVVVSVTYEQPAARIEG